MPTLCGHVDGKLRNSCKSNLDHEGLTTEDIDVVNPSINPRRCDMVFPVLESKSIKAGILDAQMRTGFNTRYDQLDVFYCLAKPTPQRCQTGVSNART